MVVRNKLTGGKVRLAASSDTLENDCVVDTVTGWTWIREFTTTFAPPPLQLVNPRKLMNDCSPSAFKKTWPGALDSTCVNPELKVEGGSWVVTHSPFAEYEDVMEKAEYTLYAVGDVLAADQRPKPSSESTATLSFVHTINCQRFHRSSRN